MKILVIFAILTSCSILESKKNYLKRSKTSFLQKEEGGEFRLIKETGFNKEKEYVVKRIVTTNQNESNILEKTITFSVKKPIKKNVQGIFPNRSQAEFKFQDNIYKSSMRIIEGDLIVSLDTPEKRWQGQRQFKLPTKESIICFYQNVIDCAKVTGFMDKALDLGYGVMNLYIIISSYPFFQDQFLNFKDTPIIRSELQYDGKNKRGEYRFSLNVSGQSIFYFLNDQRNLVRQSWISQNFSKIKM